LIYMESGQITHIHMCGGEKRDIYRNRDEHVLSTYKLVQRRYHGNVHDRIEMCVDCTYTRINIDRYKGHSEPSTYVYTST